MAGNEATHATESIADHLALEILNTQAIRDGENFDTWRDDASVVAWLIRMGLLEAEQSGMDRWRGIRRRCVGLRGVARQLIEARKKNRSVDESLLNDYLERAPSLMRLVRDRDGNLVLARERTGSDVDRAVGILAEEVASLLTAANFDLVKQCEHPDCVLWFYDRTKSHRRRWCSMALCGNRQKVARFRKRARGEQDTPS